MHIETTILKRFLKVVVFIASYKESLRFKDDITQ
jgi:hypothetical protein